VQAFTDVTEAGGGNIHRVKLAGGFGDLEKNNFNVLVALSTARTRRCAATSATSSTPSSPTAGLSVDTRGTPVATVFAIGSLHSALSRDNINNTGRGTGPTLPGSGTQTFNGINVLDLPVAPAAAASTAWPPTTRCCGPPRRRASAAPGTPAAPRCCSSR
jgi:iron complex outermembrane receptor protein